MAAEPVQHLDTAGEYAGDDPGRQTGSLAGFAVSLLLIVVGLYLINILRAQAELQDCVMSGHAACGAVEIANIAEAI